MDFEKYVKAQEEYCSTNDIPMFAPVPNCYSCGKNIWISERVQKLADKELITGCPYCSKSYVS